MVLRELVGDVAESGVAHRHLGERAVARRLHDRPCRGQHDGVHRLLVEAGEHPLRSASARDDPVDRRVPWHVVAPHGTTAGLARRRRRCP